MFAKICHLKSTLDSKILLSLFFDQETIATFIKEKIRQDLVKDLTLIKNTKRALYTIEKQLAEFTSIFRQIYDNFQDICCSEEVSEASEQFMLEISDSQFEPSMMSYNKSNCRILIFLLRTMHMKQLFFTNDYQLAIS